MPTVDLTRIGSNIGAMYSLQALLDINNKLAEAHQRLSTGNRLNSAEDDPAGLTIATKMSARSQGLGVAGDNISDAKNMLAVAESGLSKLTDIIVKMRAKATQAASDTLGTSERTTIQSQLSAFSAQIDDIINETKWNGVKLLDGTVSKQFQTGSDEGETTSWALSQKHTAGTAGLNISNAYTTAGFGSDIVRDTSFVASSASDMGTTLNGLTHVGTGRYSLQIVDKAATLAVGNIHLASAAWGGGINAATATATTASELTSGMWTFTVNAVGGGATANTDVSYTLSKIGAIGAGSSFTVSNADLSVAGSANATNGALTLTTVAATTAANLVGVTLNLTSQLTANQSFNFEYIAAGNVKYQLLDGQNQALTIDDNKGGDGTTTGLYGYQDMSGGGNKTVDTGRGLSFTLTAGLGTVNHKYTADYHLAGSYVVDVSTAQKAGQMITKYNNALDVVNQSLADLGSLEARMTIKANASASAKINVDAAYSRIMNANMAEEQVNASKFQVLQQTAVAMLAQANTAPQFLLSLFK